MPQSSSSRTIAVVIPCYRVARQIRAVIESVPAFVSHIIVVDDCCPEGSGEIARGLSDARVFVLRHEQNRGVGGAMKTGFSICRERGYDVVVKLDGDGQMDPNQIARLCKPLLGNLAAFAKFNRFWDLTALQRMPLARRIGNLGLSFLTKAASGHWRIFDPTNGFVAVRGDVLASLQVENLSNDYFFETSLLIELGKRGYRVVDLPLAARYGDETSSLRIGRVLLTFPIKLAAGGLARVWCRHFWFDFTIAAVWLSLGLPLLLWGIGLGAFFWWRSIHSGVPATAGSVMLCALPFLLGANLLMQVVSLEISNVFNSRISPDQEA